MPDDAGDRNFLPELKLIASFVPYRGPQIAQYVQAVHDRRQHHAEAMAATALARFDGAEEFFERINQDEKLQWLLETAVAEATRASSEQKARALGRVLASGALADDDAQIDEATQMLRIVADLEAVDVKVLDLLVAIKDHGPERAPRAHSMGATGKPPDTPPYYIILEDLTETAGLDPVSVQAAIGVLARHGLAVTVPVLDGGSAWRATEAASAVLGYLIDAAAQE